MTSPTSILKGQRILTPEGIRPAAVIIAGERIVDVVGYAEAPDAPTSFDAGTALVMPGVVDSHVHLNEPGRVSWEGFETGTRAAAAGGITTLIDMPLNSDPVTTTLAAFKAKLAAADQRLWVDCGFWGGIVPGNSAELAPMIAAGVLGFKAFLCHSGIDDFPRATEADLRIAMPILAALGRPLLVHAELESFGPGVAAPGADARRYATFLASRPPEMEIEAVRMAINLCRETGCAVHVVHLSAAGALPLIKAAKAEGLPVSVETCPHYLVFAAEEIPDGATEYKCAPPIRERANREKLWAGLTEGVIDFVACDHSPCTPDLKLQETGDFMGAWGGIASLQLSLSVVWTHARDRGVGLPKLAEWLCGRTAAFAGLAERKGAIAAGRDADLVVWRPEDGFHVSSDMLRHRHPTTPYLGRALSGRVDRTMLRGQWVYHAGHDLVGPLGRPVLAGLRLSHK